MAQDKRLRVIDTTKARTRADLNEHHPERAARILEFRRFGCDSAGVHASFVRRDCAKALPDLEPARAYVPNAWRTDPADPEEQFRLIQHLPLSEV